jgi:hypothetical protein
MINVNLAQLDVTELRGLIDECERELEDRLDAASRMWHEARALLEELAEIHPALLIPFARPVDKEVTLLDLDTILPENLDFYDY